MNNAIPENLNGYIDILETLRYQRYCSLACSIVMIYDHILTFEQEVKFLWNKKCSIPKALHIFVRLQGYCIVIFNMYNIFSPDVTDSSCSHWMRWQAYEGVVLFTSTAAILTLRLYALYDRSRRILIFLCSSLFICVAGILIVFIRMNDWIEGNANAVPGFRFCSSIHAWQKRWYEWAPFLLCFELFLVVLALKKGIETLKQYQRSQLSRNFTIGILVQDSVLYFVAGFITFFVNIVVWSVLPARDAEISVDFYVSLTTVISLRLLLNIRSMRYDPTLHIDDQQDLLSNARFSVQTTPTDDDRGSTLPLEVFDRVQV